MQSLLNFHNKTLQYQNCKCNERLVARYRDPGTKLHDMVTRDYHVLHLDYVA